MWQYIKLINLHLFALLYQVTLHEVMSKMLNLSVKFMQLVLFIIKIFRYILENYCNWNYHGQCVISWCWYVDVHAKVNGMLLQSLKSRGYVKEQYAWRHYYWYLTNEGIQFLRDELHLPPEIVPATLKRQTRPETARPPRAKGRSCSQNALTSDKLKLYQSVLLFLLNPVPKYHLLRHLVNWILHLCIISMYIRLFLYVNRMYLCKYYEF